MVASVQGYKPWIPTVAPQSLALGGQCLAIIKLPEALEI